jgi:hypothetical protein
MTHTTTESTAVHIHAPRPTERRLARIDCPTCKRRTFAVGWFTEWYGWDETCLRCGERWGDGERLPRPFVRGWRAKSIEQAKRRWRRGP